MSPSTLTADPPGMTAETDRPGRRRKLIEVVVPVYNECHVLETSIRRLHAYLADNLPYPFRITIADNASTDGTGEIATHLERVIPEVRAVHLDLKGRGRALRAVWSASDADVVSYMDVDLSTDLAAFLPLVAPLLSGHSDLAIGSRLARSATVTRGPKREFISRTYNLLLRATMAARFSDAQCGFKAGRTEVVQALLPLVADEEWFFDTELLLLAERTGLRIHEVPVDWVDDPDSRVNIKKTATDDLKGMWRVAKASLRTSAPAAPVRRRSVPMPDQPSVPASGTDSEPSYPLTSLPQRTYVPGRQPYVIQDHSAAGQTAAGAPALGPLGSGQSGPGRPDPRPFAPGQSHSGESGTGTAASDATASDAAASDTADRLARTTYLDVHNTGPSWVDPSGAVVISPPFGGSVHGTSAHPQAHSPLRERVHAAEPPAGLRWQLPAFATIGVFSTLAYLLLYMVLRGAMGAFLANGVALLLTAVANTAANRRFTFGVTGTRNAFRDHVGGMVAFAIGLVLSTGVLAGVHAASGHPSQQVEVLALVGANALSTLVRFVLLRAWVFHPRQAQPNGSSNDASSNDAEQKVGRLS